MTDQIVKRYPRSRTRYTYTMNQYILLLLALFHTVAFGTESNPPRWPSSVRIFSPTDTDINSTVQAAFEINGGHTPSNHGQFSKKRFAFLFKPGSYNVQVPVGRFNVFLENVLLLNLF